MTQTTDIINISWGQFAKIAKDTWLNHFQRMKTDPEYAEKGR